MITKSNNIKYVIFILILLFIAYFIDRVEVKYFNKYSFTTFFTSVSILFVLVHSMVQSNQKWKLKNILLLGATARILIFFAAPNLSDDYYRFIWDGTLIINGYNPFLYLPTEVIEWKNAEELGFTQELYNGFNSQIYYSVYPPINQAIYTLSAFLGNGNTYLSALVMRSFILTMDLGSIYFLYKLMELKNIETKYLLWYALNPLIIIELTLNLHFEGLMIFFLLGALYFLESKKFAYSGLFWGFAICAKLLPLMFLGFLVNQVKFKNVLKIGLIAISTVLVLFIPFMHPEVIENVGDSLSKYFGYFEFNAGIPYLIRAVGYQFYDYSILYKALPFLKNIFLAYLVVFSLSNFFVKKPIDISKQIYWTSIAYFLIAGIMHPWYITFIIPLGILANKKAILIWSWLVFLSYSAYESADYHENYYLITLEYIVVIGFVFYELIFAKKDKAVVKKHT